MISKQEIKRIASLARIGLNDDETNKYTKELSSILDWIEQLKEADVAEAGSVAHSLGLENKTRQDMAREFENKKGIIKLFPKSLNEYDKVKSVL